MNTLPEPSIQELKRQALIRRSDKLISWLHRPEYADYIDITSTEHLVKLIKLIIWALEKSIPKGKWQSFLEQFLEAKDVLLGYPKIFEKVKETETDKRISYNHTLAILLETLKSYKDYIESNKAT